MSKGINVVELTYRFNRAAHKDDPAELNGLLSDNYSRLRSMLSKISEPINRWNYLCDTTPDSQLGCHMMDKILDWAERTGLKITRFIPQEPLRLPRTNR